MSDLDQLLDTRAGLVIASAAFHEGVSATLKAVESSEETGIYKNPVDPYSSALLKKIKES